jgi:hypothetical protein
LGTTILATVIIVATTTSVTTPTTPTLTKKTQELKAKRNLPLSTLNNREEFF